MRVFLPFLLRSIAASKRTSSSPFGKTGTTQRGLEEETKHLLMSKIYNIVKHQINPIFKIYIHGDHVHSYPMSQVLVQYGYSKSRFK